jgi:hypothetical protein
VTAGFADLAEEITEIVSRSYGPDPGRSRGKADHTLVADFAARDGFERCVTRPAHQALMRETTGPIAESFLSAQFRIQRVGRRRAGRETQRPVRSPIATSRSAAPWPKGSRPDVR